MPMAAPANRREPIPIDFGLVSHDPKLLNCEIAQPAGVLGAWLEGSLRKLPLPIIEDSLKLHSECHSEVCKMLPRSFNNAESALYSALPPARARDPDPGPGSGLSPGPGPGLGPRARARARAGPRPGSGQSAL